MSGTPSMPSMARFRNYLTAYDAPFGPGQLLGYLWPKSGQKGHWQAKLAWCCRWSACS